MALLLRKRGLAQLRPLAGGLQGWLDRGFPTVGAIVEDVAPAS